jgi:hypothetical protein
MKDIPQSEENSNTLEKNAKQATTEEAISNVPIHHEPSKG